MDETGEIDTVAFVCLDESLSEFVLLQTCCSFSFLKYQYLHLHHQHYLYSFSFLEHLFVPSDDTLSQLGTMSLLVEQYTEAEVEEATTEDEESRDGLFGF